MKKILLDTNVVLRFLRKDDPTQSPLAAKLFEEADAKECVLLITRDVIAETVWVLRSRFKADRQDISDSLLTLMRHPGIVSPDKMVLLVGLKHYSQSETLDIVDCLLAAQAEAGEIELATFDRKIGKQISGLNLWNPSEKT